MSLKSNWICISFSSCFVRPSIPFWLFPCRRVGGGWENEAENRILSAAVCHMPIRDWPTFHQFLVTESSPANPTTVILNLINLWFEHNYPEAAFSGHMGHKPGLETSTIFENLRSILRTSLTWNPWLWQFLNSGCHWHRIMLLAY